MASHLTPKEIVAELDKYIIGQKDAKRNVAIALRNRWRRMNVQDDIQKEIVTNNILLIGSTGVGKTEIARRLATLADAPFTKVEASKFTEVGYVGRDVESMIRDLVEQSVNMVKIMKKEEVKEKVEEIVETQILDALIPPLKGSKHPYTVKLSGDEPEDEVYGLFSDEMVQRCIELGFGRACDARHRVAGEGYEVALQRWSRAAYLRLRGDGTCPQGLQLDHEVGYCVQPASGEEGSIDEAFGPFSTELVERCFRWRGGDACAGGRWARSFLKDLQDRWW